MISKIKKIVKKIPVVEKINNFRNLKKEFNNDARFFARNYVYAKKTYDRIEYDLILAIHSIEKGMASKKLRPFGIEKITKIIRLLEEYERVTKEKNYAYNLAYSCLENYMKLYEKENWCDKKEYMIVKSFLETKPDFNYIPVGSYEIKYNDFINDANIDYCKFLDSRHSVRNFSSKEISKEDIKRAVEMAIKSPSACNRQMCKIYRVKNKTIIEEVAQGLGGFDLTNANYFVVTFDIAANYFIGERNQGWFNAGLFSMNFVNALHSLGIGSCFMQFGNTFKEEQQLKQKIDIKDSERIAVVIVAGYYDNSSKIPYSSRKTIEDIYYEK